MERDGPGERVTRRGYLKRGGAVVAGALLAGCGSDSDTPTETTNGSDNQTATGTATATDETPPGDDGTPTDGSDLPYDVSVTHDETEWERYNPDWQAPTDAPQRGNFAVETLAENLDIGWDLSFGSSGELFVTERTGSIVTFDAGNLQTIAEPGSVIDAGSIEPGSDESSWYVSGGEGGLLGIAAHPTYPDPPLVYTYFTTETDSGLENRVVAFDVSADDPSGESWPIVTGIPADSYHNGGRIEFGPANYLWIATGDGDPARDNPDAIADPGTLRGKILRVNPDGSAPASNPDIGSGADPRVYTYGHRNPQGLSWLPDATPVITEHGPGQGDEINVLRAGDNYGWPEVRNSGGFDGYAGTDYQRPVADAGAWAPSGSLFYTGEKVPALQNRLLVGGLISQQLVAATIAPDDGPELSTDHNRLHDESWKDDDYHGATQPLLLDELGRIRHVEQGPDGTLYAVTSNRDGRASGRFPTERDDRLVRIVQQ